MHFTSPNLNKKHSRRRARGFNLIEIVVAIAIIAMLSAAVTVGVVKVKKGQDIELTRTNAQSLRSAVKVWWALGNKDCPTVQQLIAEGALDKSKSTQADAWGQPWVIECGGDDATVRSRGPDEALQTEDDIRVPNG
jgi:prepilin-type N-terminal cleavage/methylation domain-containing protein